MKFIIILLLPLVFTACSPDAPKADPFAQSHGSCGDEFMKDRKQLYNTCRETVSIPQVRSCLDGIYTFENKYPDYDCRYYIEQDDFYMHFTSEELSPTVDLYQSILSSNSTISKN